MVRRKKVQRLETIRSLSKPITSLCPATLLGLTIILSTLLNAGLCQSSSMERTSPRHLKCKYRVVKIELLIIEWGYLVSIYIVIYFLNPFFISVIQIFFKVSKQLLSFTSFLLLLCIVFCLNSHPEKEQYPRTAKIYTVSLFCLQPPMCN